MTRTLTIRDARTLAQIVNLAERCRCAYRTIAAEHRAEASSYRVLVDIHGTSEALRLFESRLNRILTHDEETV